MSGVVTWTRHRGKDDLIHARGGRGNFSYTYANLYRLNGGTGVGTVNAPQQTTTSYRTGVVGEDLTKDPTSKLGQKALLLSDASYSTGRKGSTQWDTGNEFSTEKTELFLTHPSVRLEAVDTSVSSKPVVWYEGFLLPSPNHYSVLAGQTWPYYPPVAPLDLEWYGTKAVRETIPLNPTVSLSVFLGELLQKIPQAVGAALLSGKGTPISNAGREHLNFEFGLRPTGSELGKIAAAVLDASERIKQLQRDSGRVVRRQYDFPVVKSVDVNTSKSGSGVLLNTAANTADRWNPLFWNGGVPSGKFFETVTTSRRIWFSGAYSYYLQTEKDSVPDRLAAYEEYANAILGTRITPSTLWELAPWSWFGDWVANVGDNIANAASLREDGLVLRYGYVMCEEIRERTVTVEGVRLRDGSTLPPISARWRTTSKRRRRADPYGFALKPGSFTARQWAILAALGMTKSDKTLRRKS